MRKQKGRGGRNSEAGPSLEEQIETELDIVAREHDMTRSQLIELAFARMGAEMARRKGQIH